MTDDVSRPRIIRPSNAEIAFAWFQRIIAGYCLFFGILYWIRLIGVYDGAMWRFDLMPVHWQIVAVMLAVFFPFAAIGLWMLSSWGPVIWFICAVTEVVMYAGFPELFGSRPLIIASHVLVAAIYIAFRVYIHRQKTRVEQ